MDCVCTYRAKYQVALLFMSMKADHLFVPGLWKQQMLHIMAWARTGPLTEGNATVEYRHSIPIVNGHAKYFPRWLASGLQVDYSRPSCTSLCVCMFTWDNRTRKVVTKEGKTVSGDPSIYTTYLTIFAFDFVDKGTNAVRGRAENARNVIRDRTKRVFSLCCTSLSFGPSLPAIWTCSSTMNHTCSHSEREMETHETIGCLHSIYILYTATL